MPYNEKKSSVIDVLRKVFKNKKEEKEDIVSQAEKIISDYINKRRNEIIDKYCKKSGAFLVFTIFAISLGLIYGMYFVLK